MDAYQRAEETSKQLQKWLLAGEDGHAINPPGYQLYIRAYQRLFEWMMSRPLPLRRNEELDFVRGLDRNEDMFHVLSSLTAGRTFKESISCHQEGNYISLP